MQKFKFSWRMSTTMKPTFTFWISKTYIVVLHIFSLIPKGKKKKKLESKHFWTDASSQQALHLIKSLLLHKRINQMTCSIWTLTEVMNNKCKDKEKPHTLKEQRKWRDKESKKGIPLWEDSYLLQGSFHHLL